MSTFEKEIAQLVQSRIQEKDEEIKQLKEQNDKLKEELKQIKTSDPQFVPNRNVEFRNKAIELKKAIDDILGHSGQEHPNRIYPRQLPGGIQVPMSYPSVSISAPNADANKPSTSTNVRTGSAEEPSTNGTSHVNHTNYSGQEEFSTRPVNDTELVTDEQSRQQHHFMDMKQSSHNNHNIHALNLPTTTVNNNPHRRFQHNGINGLSGMNNNSSNRNRNNHNNNNNNKQHQYTIFISWPGNMTIEQLRELFETTDIVDIRYTHPKQFAHVDLKSEHALSKAMALNGQTKNETQGQLRVEHGKPRSSNNNNNPTENNSQRSQNQNKNYNTRQNKNVNGYNNNSPQKHNNNKLSYNYNNHNNHNRPSFGPSEEKDNGITSGWHNFSSSEAKQNGDSV